MFGHPHLDLFATQANANLTLYVSPVLDLLVWKQDSFRHPWDHLSAYAFLPFALLRQVLSWVLALTGLSLILVAQLRPQQEWFADFLLLLVDELLKFLLIWNLFVQPHRWKLHRGLHSWRLSSVSSERQTFRERLRMVQLWTSDAPLLLCTCPRGPGSSVVAID